MRRWEGGQNCKGTFGRKKRSLSKGTRGGCKKYQMGKKRGKRGEKGGPNLLDRKRLKMDEMEQGTGKGFQRKETQGRGATKKK